MTVILIGIGGLGTVTKGLVPVMEELKIRGQEDHLIGSIIEISQNTEKSPGDMRKLAVTQSQVKNHQLKTEWKSLKREE